jgi:hypothetical protein
MDEISSLIDGCEKLTTLFGEWPSFHDAEILDMNLWRGDVKSGDWDDANVFPILTINIQILEATQAGAAHLGNDVVATIRFHDVEEFKMEGFNYCNQIAGFRVGVRARGKFNNGTDLPPHLIVHFEPGFGVGASFRCYRIEVVNAAFLSSERQS